ncbi:MAG: bifunctional tetrahydrofolate synthase/dihydrofolate synthase [Proteobacteria bacterium]|nr:bifunctional tetrahydrofolate synthase/dihydrofolate synthase [Pseudomonadota bacterium]
MRFNTLEGWLHWQESLHPNEIELGLDRVSLVLARLDLANPDFTVVTVAGTNGKGSSVAMLQSILLESGYRVGTYTSPHLLRYNERIQINGIPVDDNILCESFERVDQARDLSSQQVSQTGSQQISLTYFEFGTLAAIDIFQRANVQIALLEVGLGGRLDAVNILDADVALITAIDIDHQSWLGTDRETIAREKAGILRPGQVAICADPNPPAALVDVAEKLSTLLFLPGEDFGVSSITNKRWEWRGIAGQLLELPLPTLAGDFQVANAAGVLAVVEQLYERKHIPRRVDEQEITRGLENASLPGRFQIAGEKPMQILDVAHNPHSARALADNLEQQICRGKTRAVVAMLADKDIPAVLSCMTGLVNQWYLASLHVPRGAPAQQLQDGLDGQDSHIFDDVTSAYQAALSEADPEDRIVVFGSFFTVAEVLPQAV